MSSQIRKKSGEIEAFSIKKLEKSLRRAMADANTVDASSQVARQVSTLLEKETSSEDLQDIVLDVLLKAGLKDVAEQYAFHVPEHKIVNHGLKHYFSKDLSEAHFSRQAISLLREKYLDDETPKEMLRRVAKKISSIENGSDKKKWESKFFESMKELDFLPNSFCLRNAGKNDKALFLTKMTARPTSVASLLGSLAMSVTHEEQFGVHVSLSKTSAEGMAMKMIHMLNRVIESNKEEDLIGVHIRSNHPEIMDFIAHSKDNKHCHCIVEANPKFMRSVVNDSTYWLLNERNTKLQRVESRFVFDLLCKETLNDSGLSLRFEQDSSTLVLGSINLAHMVRNKRVDWVRLSKQIETSTRFFRNMLDLSDIPRDRETFGLGLMGWADALLSLGVVYGSDEACKLAEEVTKFITDRLEYESRRLKGLRIEVCVSPDTEISQLANCSPGISALEEVGYQRRGSHGESIRYVHPQFEQIARFGGFYSRALMDKVISQGHLQKVSEIPKDVKDLFSTTPHITLERQIDMQAAFQKHAHGEIANTIVLGEKASVGDVWRSYLLAWKQGIRTVTIRRKV